MKECLQGSLAKIIAIRDDIGANLAEVSFVTRTWTGHRVGDGTFTDEVTPFTSNPEIVDFSHDIRTQQNGTYASGDLILRTINRADYSEEDLRTDTGIANIEKFIKIDDHFYRTIHVRQRLLTWNVHVRRISQDETERQPQNARPRRRRS